jgi:hypothetical protein
MDEQAQLCWYHKNVSSIIAATHYARHYCPTCEAVKIIAICGRCAKNYEEHIARIGNYPWICDSCGNDMQRRIVGRIDG